MSVDITLLPVPARLDLDAIATLHSGLANVAPGGVIMLRGAVPDTFCAGLDLSRVTALDDAALRQGLRAYAALLLAIAEAPVPVITVVEGEAFGGGVGIVAIADVVLATPEARFGLPEARHGFYPAIVFAALDLRISPQRSRRLALQCESIDAAAAHECGLVDEVIETAALEPTVSRWARRLSRATPDAITAMRAHAPHRDRLRASLDAGVEATARALASTAVRKAIAEALR
jgi:enoyl-CoA hydratase/carnithine racemase